MRAPDTEKRVGCACAVGQKTKYLGGYLLKDLKHLIYFEKLLQEANNELVKQGKADGKRAIGYTCYFMPEEIGRASCRERV